MLHICTFTIYSVCLTGKQSRSIDEKNKSSVLIPTQASCFKRKSKQGRKLCSLSHLMVSSLKFNLVALILSLTDTQNHDGVVPPPVLQYLNGLSYCPTV